MKIGVFVYDFPHWKSTQGLLNLMVAGFRPLAVFGQEKKKLTIGYSNIPIVPKWLHLHETEEIAELFGLHYVVNDHDSQKTINLIKSLDLDVGVVLGARILKKQTIEAFNIGILNCHPGLIPINRGLDNIKWAILDGIKQGVTAHLIDHRVDMGRVIKAGTVAVTEEDTLVDIHLRVQEVEQIMMLECLQKLESGDYTAFEPVEEGKHNKAMTMDEEVAMLQKFDYYKTYYAKMRDLVND